MRTVTRGVKTCISAAQADHSHVPLPLKNLNYPGLRMLLEKYGPDGFEVLAFPCNQFGGQAPLGSEGEREYAFKKFGIDTFPVFVSALQGLEPLNFSTTSIGTPITRMKHLLHRYDSVVQAAALAHQCPFQLLRKSRIYTPVTTRRNT